MRDFLKTLVIFLLRLEARLVLRKYDPHIVAVTGSVGKTSTKDAIFAVLSQSRYVRKSDKSFNSEIGLPLTILGCPNAWNNPLRWLQNIFDGLLLVLFPARYPAWLVLEVGADRPGDISSLAKWLRVDIAVITHLPEVPVHVEFFDSPEAVVEEKASLINALKPGGTLVLYADDERARALAPRAQERDASIVLFGLSEHAQVRGEHFMPLHEEGKESWPIGMRFDLSAEGSSAPVSVVGVVGAHLMLSTIAAAAVGTVLRRGLPEIVQGLGAYEAPHGRMHLISGIKGTLLIDDTYNSSPAAVMAALDALDTLPIPGRKIVALADMLELGRHSVDEHRKIGARAAKTADLLVTVGFRARDIAQGALDNGLPEDCILQYESAEAAGNELQSMVKQGDCILAKGSQSMRMERLVEELMAEPERAGELLVRQEREWKHR